MRNVLPPTEKRKQFELRALALRDFAGVDGDRPLDPFALAKFAKLLVVDFDRIEGLSPESRAHLLGQAADQWSGGACSQPLPNGWRLVVLNPSHGKQRNRATLMEEITHVFLGHKPSRLAKLGRDVSAGEEPSLKRSVSSQQTLARDYNHADEEAAYAIGAAALVPYAALHPFVISGRKSGDIARHFRVSVPLVEYRIKVTHLWAEYRSLQTAKPDRRDVDVG